MSGRLKPVIGWRNRFSILVAGAQVLLEKNISIKMAFGYGETELKEVHARVSVSGFWIVQAG